jgi:small subunit ribosomal protein S1
MLGGDEKIYAEDMSNNEFEKYFDAEIKAFKEGDVIKGTVIEVTKDSVMIDVGYKSEGVVSIKEFLGDDGKPTIKVGDEVSVLLERREDENGYVRLSKIKADQFKIWDTLIEAYDKGTSLKGTITQRIKGGFYVDINGIISFLPGSQVDLKPVRNPDALIGEVFDFVVLKHNRRKNNVIVSRRAILEKEREGLRKITMEKLEEGAIVEGLVKNITDYGAFIDLGGIDGLVHLTDLSWGKVSHPSQVLGIGDTLKVKVLKFNKEDGKISLGLKQTKPDPWLTVAEKYPVGSKVSGRVVNITDYGAFVELEKGLEGLVHISEMSWTKIKHPSQKLKVDDQVDIQILAIDADSKRISLGIKQVEPNPWDGAEQRYPKGTVLQGVIKNITDFGIFVGIEDGIDGLVHISDLTWKKVRHPADIFKKGQEVTVEVLSIDSNKKRFSLSTKQLEKNPWEGVSERYKPGMIVEGSITSVADFGAFVELEDGLEGLVHISELNMGKKKGSEVKCGDIVEVEVLNVDPDDNKIGLSIRGIKKSAPEAPAEAQEDRPAGEEPVPDAGADTEVEADAAADEGAAAEAGGTETEVEADAAAEEDAAAGAGGTETEVETEAATEEDAAAEAGGTETEVEADAAAEEDAAADEAEEGQTEEATEDEGEPTP